MVDPLLIVLFAAGVIGMFAAVLAILRDREQKADEAPESPFAVSTEGMKVCPKCGMGNLVTDATCSACGTRLA